MQWNDQALRDPAQQAAAPNQTPADGRRIGPPAVRQLAPHGITGALQTVVEPADDAARTENAITYQTVGDRRMRTGNVTNVQPAVGTTGNTSSVGNALHPTLYHRGSGGWHKTETACSQAHFQKFRLASVNPKFRRAQEVRLCSCLLLKCGL